jgi:Tol biopolymer transport system component
MYGVLRSSPHARNAQLGRSALFTVNVDGSGLKQITPWGISIGDADWAPDGKKLVVEVDNRCHGEIYTVDPDGKHLKNITHNTCHGGIADPVWSPNGKKILSRRRTTSTAASPSA